MKKIISILLVLAVAFAFCGFTSPIATAADPGSSLPVIGSMTDSLTAINHEITISASTSGLGVYEELLNQGLITILTNGGEQNGAIQLTVSLPKCSDLSVILSSEAEALSFAFPDFSDTVYEISAEYLKKLLTDYLSQLDYLNTDGLTEGNFLPITTLPNLSEYGEILMQLSNAHNTTMEQKVFTLPACQKDVDCSVLCVTPARSDWTSLITNLAATARQDETLAEFLKYVLAGTYMQNRTTYSAYYTEEVFVAQTMDSLYQQLAYYEQNAADVAAMLDGTSLTVATDGNRIHAIILENSGAGIGYESYGDPESGRSDAIVSYDFTGGAVEKLILNTLQQSGDGFIGRFTVPSGGILLSYILQPADSGWDFDIRAIIAGMEINLVKTGRADGMTLIGSYDDGNGINVSVTIDSNETQETVTLPGGDTVEITDESGMQAAMQDLALLFGTWATENGLA